MEAEAADISSLIGTATPRCSALVRNWAQGPQNPGIVSIKLGLCEVNRGFINWLSKPCQSLAKADFLAEFGLLIEEYCNSAASVRSSSRSSGWTPTGIWKICILRIRNVSYRMNGNTSKNESTGTVMPPLIITVAMVITQVVVKNICRTSVTGLFKANAKAIAPRRPL